MSGGITQLVSTGVQDVHLTGNPQVSFFRSQYKQYTHFAHSVERQILQGQPSPGGISTIRVERKGDLLSYMYLTASDNTGKLRSDLDWSQIIDRVEVLIGGQVIDLQDPFYTYVVDPVCMANKYSQRYYPLSQSIQAQDNPFYPLKFFFCKEWQTALPLVALQMHDVDIRITWSQFLGTQFPQSAPTGINTSTANEDGSALYYITAGGPGTSATVSVSNVIGQVNLGAVAVGSAFTGLAYVSATSITSGAGTVTLQLSNSQTWSTILASAQNDIQFYDPKATASLFVPAVVSGKSVVATVNSEFGAPVQPIVPGMVVTNLPTIAGLVYVSDVTYSANNVAASVTLNFPTQSFSAIVSQTAGFFTPNVSVEPTTPSNLLFAAWADFIYLDVNEREYFAKNKFDMLITQVQRVPIGTEYTQDIVFNHPVKFIASNVSSYSDVNQQLLLQINGVDIGEYKPLPHYVDVPHYYHTPYGFHGAGHTAKVPVMLVPFCLDTASYQPTGTLNFSRIDSFRLKSVLASGFSLDKVLGSGVGVAPQGYFYAVNYNILTIQSGMGGLRYGN